MNLRMVGITSSVRSREPHGKKRTEVRIQQNGRNVEEKPNRNKT